MRRTFGDTVWLWREIGRRIVTVKRDRHKAGLMWQIYTLDTPQTPQQKARENAFQISACLRKISHGRTVGFIRGAFSIWQDHGHPTWIEWVTSTIVILTVFIWSKSITQRARESIDDEIFSCINNPGDDNRLRSYADNKWHISPY